MKTINPGADDRWAQRRRFMRNKAITIFELTKGFTSKPDRGGEAMLEMARYVLELTADLPHAYLDATAKSGKEATK